MILETERLELVALLPDQLRLWIENITVLERVLKCSYKAEPMEGVFLEIVKGQLEITEKNPNNYMWHSFWFLICKNNRVVVGCADFKNSPNSNHEVEIGYGLGKEHEHNGYMAEAVQALCNWAMNQENVSHIIAETELENFASQHVLQRCGFVKEKSKGTIWWKL